MGFLELIRSHAAALPPLAKFALSMTLIFGIPALSRRVRMPAVVGLMLSGVVIGPHVLGIFGEQRPIADFLANVGKLLLMFVAGLNMDLARFRQTQTKSITFGLTTAAVPLVLGAAVGLGFGYASVAAIVVGSLLASHTLLGSRVVAEMGANRLEPVTVTIGATLLSDTLSLVMFAICVATYENGFSVAGVAIQLGEIAVFIPFILFGLSRIGAYFLTKAQTDDNAYFVLMFSIMAVAGVLARSINLPDIVGAFLAGLSVNEAAHDHPAKEKLEFFGNAFFIPIFYIATGFLIDPQVFIPSIIENFSFTAALVMALVAGKWLAAEVCGRAFKYASAARLTMWSLTLPQVATTLAATLVAFNTLDAAQHRLIDERIVHAVLVLMLITATLGPVLTQHFAQRLLEDSLPNKL